MLREMGDSVPGEAASGPDRGADRPAQEQGHGSTRGVSQVMGLRGR